MTSLTWGARDSQILIGRSLRHLPRNLESLLMAVILPVLLMLLFVYVFGGAISTGTDYVNYVVPGIILLCAAFGASMTAVNVASDMTNGIIDRFRTMPIASSAVLTGHVAASLVRNALSTALVIGVAYLAGFHPSASTLEWLATVGILALFVLAISWVSVCLGLIAKSPEAASGYTFGFAFLPYVSSAFVPPETMPAVLRGIAEHQPVTPVIETARGLLMGTPIGNSVWLSLAWFGGLLVVSYGLAGVLFRRRTSR
jgi:ABC-2 type transport system permease protein